MENEVIIDGVDVSECVFQAQNQNLTALKHQINMCKVHICDIGYGPYCEYNSDCYFKQLQRLKAENELLKKEVETWKYQTEKRAEIGEAWFEVSQKFKTALESRKAENEKLKEWLENKEKAYIHLRNANSRKKEQIKNLNYMLFEENEMTTKEWKLKYRLANKERKFIQYKEISKNQNLKYKQALEEIREMCELYIDDKADLTPEQVIDIISEVLK